MDPLSAATICLDVISGIIKLIENWKSRNQYLESVREYVNSVGETLRKYQTKGCLQKPLAYEGLQKTLNEFEKFIKKYHNQQGFFQFFKSGSFQKECESLIERIQQWMASMQLSLSLQYGDENAKSFSQILEILNRMEQAKNMSKCGFKERFKNAAAAMFWIKYFENEENVEWIDFQNNFKAYIWRGEKIDLSQRVLDEICAAVDVDGNKIVNFTEWDNFYVKIWNNFNEKAKFINMSENVKASNFFKPALPTLNLIYIQTNKNSKSWESRKKPYDFPINHVFEINNSFYQYQRFDCQMVKQEKNLEKSALVVGREDTKNHNFTPDIVFSKIITTMSRKQFHITAKNLANEKGYFITDLSSSNPTTFRVRDKPYALVKGMILDLNTYFLEVSEIYPRVSEDESQKDYYYLPTDGRVGPDGIHETLRRLNPKYESDSESDEDDKTRQGTKKRRKPGKANSPLKQPPFVRLRVMNGFLPEIDEEGGKTEFYLSPEDIESKFMVSKRVAKTKEIIFLKNEVSNKMSVFSFGSGKDNDIAILDEACEESICQLYYDPKYSAWFVVERHPLSQQKEFSNQTLIYLKSFVQLKENKLGPIGYKLRDGMEICCNNHVFKVQFQEK